MTNLFDNGVKYGDSSQPVRVNVFGSTFQEKPYVTIQVSNAPGTIGYPDPNKVFDKYYRAPLAFQRTGSGLGLFLIKNIMVTLHGQLLYKPSDSAVTFEIMLPIFDLNI